MCALQGFYGQIGLAKENGIWYLQTVVKDADGSVRCERIPAEEKRIWLKTEFYYSEQREEASFFFSSDGENWTPFGNPVKLKFTLDIFMGCRVGSVQLRNGSDRRICRFQRIQADLRRMISG